MCLFAVDSHSIESFSVSDLDVFRSDLRAAVWSGAGAGLLVQTNEGKFAFDWLCKYYRDSVKYVYVWTRRAGVRSPFGNRLVPDTSSFADALKYASKLDEKCAVIFRGASEELASAVKASDKLTLDVLRSFVEGTFYKSSSRRVQPVFIGSLFTVPSELAEFFQVLDFPLPGYAELEVMFEQSVADDRRLVEEHGYDFSVSDVLKRALVNASLGLTRTEAKIAFNHAKFSKSFSSEDVGVIAELKSKKYADKALEYYDSSLNLSDIGGLENLKEWLLKRKPLWLTDPGVTLIPKPKGVLLTGLPGTGKSLTAKAIASVFDFPLIRFDVGAVFGKYYGESERGLKSALKAAEANAPCVLWIDEIEKGLGSSTGGVGEGNAQTREAVVGALLTWMQERRSDVFIVATANNLGSLRPEMLRKGRFDEIFFVDLPSEEDRKSIFGVHLGKRVPDFAGDVGRLVAASEGFVGAEIEQAIIAAMIEAFAAGVPVGEAGILAALDATNPLSVSQRELLDSSRRWARDTQAVYAGRGGSTLKPAGFRLRASEV